MVGQGAKAEAAAAVAALAKGWSRGRFAGRYFEISPRSTTDGRLFSCILSVDADDFLGVFIFIIFFSRSLLGFVYDFFLLLCFSSLVFGFCFYLGFVLGFGSVFVSGQMYLYLGICICIFICGAAAGAAVFVVAVAVSLLYLLALF